MRTAVQCCNCLRVLGIDFEERKQIGNIWCLSCLIEQQKEKISQSNEETKNEN